MIAQMRGRILETGESRLVISLGSLGLEVRVPSPTWGRWAQERGEVTLFTHLHVRENELSLYGCETREEMALFQLLLTVSGVGPKLALGALSTLRPEELQAALARGEVATLTRVPGIGRRLAERMVLELKDKVEIPALVSGRTAPPAQREELLQALTSLGYSQVEAQEAARTLPPEDLPLEEQVRLALSYFSGGR